MLTFFVPEFLIFIFMFMFTVSISWTSAVVAGLTFLMILISVALNPVNPLLIYDTTVVSIIFSYRLSISGL